MSAAFRHRFALVDGVELHWAELGEPGTRVPLVLIHGIADSHLSWRAVAPELACDRLVLMPDLPGCGMSGRPDASYALEWHAKIIAQWLEQLELPSVDVVGHSYGGGVAQMLLLACPGRIRRLVLAASGGLGREVGFWLKFATFPHFVEHYGQAFMAFGTRRALGYANAEHAKLDIAALARMNAEPGTARAFSRTVRDVIGFGGQTRHFLQRAHEVKSLPPIAVLWGERDNLIPMAHGQQLADRVQGVVFRSFPDCGHYLHQERPREFVRAVDEFLAATNPPAVSLRRREVAPRAWLETIRKAGRVLTRTRMPDGVSDRREMPSVAATSGDDASNRRAHPCADA